MTIKRTLAMVLAVLCLAGALPVSAAVTENIKEELVSGCFVCTVTTNSTTGNKSVEIVGYTGTDQAEVIIPATIEGISVTGNSTVFQEEHPEITRLVLSEGFRKVPAWNLAYLPNLQEVVLPQTLKVIGGNVFRNCPNLKTLTIPSGVAVMAGMDPYSYLIPGTPPFDPDITLRAEAGSYVERYAAFHGLAFEPIVYEVSLGDLDADGLCTTTDARLVLQHTVGKAALDEAFADVDGDGEVTSTDARLCLQYAVGKGELSLDVPATRPSGNLISSAAQVYAEFRMQEEYRPYGPAADRSAAIRAINGIVGGSYDTADGFLDMPPIVRKTYTIVEPDGTTIRIRDMGFWEVSAYGERLLYFSGAKEDWDALAVAIG